MIGWERFAWKYVTFCPQGFRTIWVCTASLNVTPSTQWCDGDRMNNWSRSYRHYGIGNVNIWEFAYLIEQGSMLCYQTKQKHYRTKNVNSKHKITKRFLQTLCSQVIGGKLRTRQFVLYFADVHHKCRCFSYDVNKIAKRTSYIWVAIPTFQIRYVRA